MSETSVSVVRPPSGRPAMTSSPLSRAISADHCSAELGAHAQVFVRLEAPLVAAQQLHHDALAGRHALAGDRADVRMVLVLGGELAFLLLAALGGVEIGQRLHHGQHDVARFAVAGLAVVPHAVDVLPDDDRLLRVVEDRTVAAAIDHVGDQFLDEQIAGRLAGRDQIRLVVAFVGGADGHQVDRCALFVVGLPLGRNLHADFAAQMRNLVAEPIRREHLFVQLDRFVARHDVRHERRQVGHR